MSRGCPSCPDGNEWGATGPTGRVCPTCKGTGEARTEPDAWTEPSDEQVLADLAEARGYALLAGMVMIEGGDWAGETVCIARLVKLARDDVAREPAPADRGIDYGIPGVPVPAPLQDDPDRVAAPQEPVKCQCKIVAIDTDTGTVRREVSADCALHNGSPLYAAPIAQTADAREVIKHESWCSTLQECDCGAAIAAIQRDGEKQNG
jgi:hypothetical protein